MGRYLPCRGAKVTKFDGNNAKRGVVQQLLKVLKKYFF
jgi:hypothetical protein